MAKDYVSKYECDTRIKWSSCSITWTINEISKLYIPSHKPLESGKFSTKLNHIWQLKLFQDSNSSLMTCAAFLCNVTNEYPYARYDGSIAILQNEVRVLNVNKKGYTNGKFDQSSSLSLNFRPDSQKIDPLTIYCEINVAIEHIDLFCPSPVWDEGYLLRSLNQQIEKFQGNQFLTDVDLQVSGKTFKGHKLILAAVSPVFEKMFQGKSQENQNNRVIIKDVRADVFEELMTYIYSGKLPHLKEMSSDLLAVADKYSILPLLRICMNDLMENMSVDDAAATCVLADRHSLHIFKLAIIRYIKKHFYDVATSAGWISLVTHHPQLTKEIQDKLREKTV